MSIERGDIVVLRDEDGLGDWSDEHHRVEMVVGNNASIRNLSTYMVSKENVDKLVVVYSTVPMENGRIVECHLL
jgi:hypothetical protein